jgi:hypothetical protein
MDDKNKTFYGMDVDEFLTNLQAILSRGDRVEIMPVKDGVRITRIKRQTVYRNRK